MNISFFNLHFDLFSIIAKEVNQIRNNVVCVVACLVYMFCCVLTMGCCNAFELIFRKLKGIRVLQSIFQDYAISCDYGFIKQVATLSDQICLRIIFLLFDVFCFSRIYLQTTQNIM